MERPAITHLFSVCFTTHTLTASQIPTELLLPPAERNLEALIDWTFGDITTAPSNPHIFLHRAIVTPLNDHVDAINALLTERFPGEGQEYVSADTPGSDINAALQGSDILHHLHPTGMPPHLLTLKPGMPCMVIRNLHSGLGLVNGTRLQVRRH